MSLPVQIQNSGVVTGASVTSINVVLTNVTTGNSVIIGATEWTGSRTLSCADGVPNSYSVRVSKTNAGNAKTTYIFDDLTITGVVGPVTITVTDSASGNLSAVAEEVSNITAFDVSGSVEEVSGVSTHISNSPSLDTSANSYGMTAGQLNQDDRPYTANAFTALGDDGFFSFFQSGVNNQPLSGLSGTWNSAGNLRLNTGVLAVYKGSAAVDNFLLVKN